MKRTCNVVNVHMRQQQYGTNSRHDEQLPHTMYRESQGMAMTNQSFLAISSLHYLSVYTEYTDRINNCTIIFSSKIVGTTTVKHTTIILFEDYANKHACVNGYINGLLN